ncbi:MAG: SIMPL domain-containing protein [Deltaproteobacteria bacterium]|nr:SIMPL domain-containing protein [Deltaproteobacteria bacterium]
MKKFWLVAVSLVLMLAVVGFSGCTGGPTTIGTVDINSQQSGIWVSGTGKVAVTPDIATLSLGIEAQADTVAEAQAQAATAMEALMTALTDSGVAEKDIQTRHFSIYQVTRWDDYKDEQVVTGYRVTNMVTAKIRDIEQAGPVIDAVAAASGDYTRINNISFSVEDPTAYYEEARQVAMTDAKSKAGQLADLAGVNLGKPTYISEGNISSPVVYRDAGMEMMAPAPTTPISPGEIELTLTVQVAYAIAD